MYYTVVLSMSSYSMLTCHTYCNKKFCHLHIYQDRFIATSGNVGHCGVSLSEHYRAHLASNASPVHYQITAYRPCMSLASRVTTLYCRSSYMTRQLRGIVCIWRDGTRSSQWFSLDNCSSWLYTQPKSGLLPTSASVNTPGLSCMEATCSHHTCWIQLRQFVRLAGKFLLSGLSDTTASPHAVDT